ncbi:MAG TPA: hypothetical protein QF353_02135 [Gammaproteobacteria bacterium]|nr:hypothetical protein [Gammaproteobacteria bacterium]
MRKNLLSLFLIFACVQGVCADQQSILLINQSKYFVRVDKVDNDGMDVTGLRSLAPSSNTTVTYRAKEPSSTAFYLYFYQDTPVVGLSFYYDQDKKKEKLTVMPYINSNIGIYYDLIRKTITINTKD